MLSKSNFLENVSLFPKEEKDFETEVNKIEV